LSARNSQQQQQNGSSSTGSGGSGRTIQIYGTMNALQNNFQHHQPQIIQQQNGRNGSICNHSDVQIVQQDQSFIEDTQSAQTVIVRKNFIFLNFILINLPHYHRL